MFHIYNSTKTYIGLMVVFHFELFVLSFISSIKMSSDLILPRFRRTADVIQVKEHHLENKFPPWETVKLLQSLG